MKKTVSVKTAVIASLVFIICICALFLIMQVQLAEQTRSFIYATALGLCLGGVYDFFRCLRALAGAKRWVTMLCVCSTRVVVRLN